MRDRLIGEIDQHISAENTSDKANGRTSMGRPGLPLVHGSALCTSGSTRHPIIRLKYRSLSALGSVPERALAINAPRARSSMRCLRSLATISMGCREQARLGQCNRHADSALHRCACRTPDAKGGAFASRSDAAQRCGQRQESLRLPPEIRLGNGEETIYELRPVSVGVGVVAGAGSSSRGTTSCRARPARRPAYRPAGRACRRRNDSGARRNEIPQQCERRRGEAEHVRRRSRPRHPSDRPLSLVRRRGAQVESAERVRSRKPTAG